MVADPCNRASSGDRQKARVDPAFDYIVVGGGTAGNLNLALYSLLSTRTFGDMYI